MSRPADKPQPFYFAYGSNMNPAQIEARCRKPEVVATARLPDHRLGFFGSSKIWDGGEESAQPEPGADLWGVVYRLSFHDAEILDTWQKVWLDGTGPYFHFPTQVFDAEGRNYPVLLYKRDVLGPRQKPSAPYLDHIIAGAMARALPPPYIDLLRAIPTCQASTPVPRKASFNPEFFAGLACQCGD
ncbi:hypothetical protein F11_07180 [Rhodospirillum rubrum F11]|uniref:Gamma-glutamylcyclotransferase AIG2-like domain-containing protein n=2 Tax=Rhodospirillum rubrum TaxID=1085 RepID=Q2RUK4_RHORT|nr:gamma-glutamylcyclotransferase family protein [Rhodospirillum rubrum]ABC22191.1 conserved hypothetical protein [Rhodospirillum rubrum ATCC 11170]AEO47906.1 hypothetical protein F11_07180 [Rhodospirillum rubrum F11]MBK5953781.1 gamma-glutamylcyclotransferase [Rhodospirillum rubrum]QXG81838.1 gamma-glutamylcyclotransferase [Rhodospirillum rubrum]